MEFLSDDLTSSTIQNLLLEELCDVSDFKLCLEQYKSFVHVISQQNQAIIAQASLALAAASAASEESSIGHYDNTSSSTFNNKFNNAVVLKLDDDDDSNNVRKRRRVVTEDKRVFRSRRGGNNNNTGTTVYSTSNEDVATQPDGIDTTTSTSSGPGHLQYFTTFDSNSSAINNEASLLPGDVEQEQLAAIAIDNGDDRSTHHHEHQSHDEVDHRQQNFILLQNTNTSSEMKGSSVGGEMPTYLIPIPADFLNSTGVQEQQFLEIDNEATSNEDLVLLGEVDGDGSNDDNSKEGSNPQVIHLTPDMQNQILALLASQGDEGTTSTAASGNSGSEVEGTGTEINTDRGNVNEDSHVVEL